MSGLVLISSAQGVCELRLNRPDKRNALTLAMYEALTQAMQQAEQDDSVRAILLGGEGASFCAGNDLQDFLSSTDLGEAHSAVRLLRLLPRIRKPLIAAVHGRTVGFGVTLLLHCDLVLAGRGAQLSMPFVRLGLVPEAASSLLLPRLIGHQRAAELLFLGSPLDAAEAFRLGLVNQVVEEERLPEEARALARSVAQQPTGALLATRRLLRGSPDEIDARITEELHAFRAQLRSEEFRTAAQAFFTKRRPE
ncbi:MAG TPA: enoyl-CoA hydratase [Steroidobacteraceae bacterium]|nr:enoyl-CoA hydratase [Steroidobacteraceae bacterium]